MPVIVAPAGEDDAQRTLRNEDVYRLILERAGLSPDAPPHFADDELLLTELEWLTYRSGPWKSYYRRSDGAFFLVDLREDASETRDVRALHPQVEQAHRARILELASSLAAVDARPAPISDEDKARLKTLGYLDED